MPMRRILVPTDFSSTSMPALSNACELAASVGAELVLLHVVESPIYPGLVQGSAAGDLSVVRDHALENARTELERMLRESVPEGVTGRAVVREGTPWQEIVDAAESENADLVVCATHGRSGLRHLVLGSVAERVVRHAPCPVLTVRAPAGDRAG